MGAEASCLDLAVESLDEEAIRAAGLIEAGGRSPNVDGAYHAFGNQRNHVSGPLVEGELEGENVTCPWHATFFNIKSGEALAGPGTEPVPIYEVRVESDDIQIAKT